VEINKVLTMEGIYSGNADSKYQYYQVILTDHNGKKYLASIGCTSSHKETCEKTFRRLILVPAPTMEQMTESNKGEPKNEIHLVKNR